jgi:hypothetical protein
VRGVVERRAAADERRESEISWWEFVPVIGDIWGGDLNAGESEDPALSRATEQAIQDVIKDVEAAEQRSLSEEERAELDQLVRAAVTTSIIQDEGEAEQHAP